MSAPPDDEGFARALLGAARADRPAPGAASRAHEAIARAGGARTPLERRACAVLSRALRVAVAVGLVCALARPGASADVTVAMGTGGMTPGVGEASPPPRPAARPLAESGTGRFLPRRAARPPSPAPDRFLPRPARAKRALHADPYGRGGPLPRALRRTEANPTRLHPRRRRRTPAISTHPCRLRPENHDALLLRAAARAPR